jgi:Copper type II ascorbate-dependent monooxygenase, C-terminal domain
MKDIQPGANVSHCQYVQAPLDRDVDVLDVQGHQSAGGHHAVAYATTTKVPVGTSRECLDADQLLGGFLGGVGGEAGGGVELPPGTAFRLPKGSAIMVNTHFVNTSDDPFDGQSVVDFKFVEVDPKRSVASIFTSGTMNFKMPVGKDYSKVAECVLPRDFKFILFTNHMHEWGTHAKSEVVRADGKVELIHEDPKWQPELAFKAAFSKWKPEVPLVLHKGDKLRTYCNWNNTTASDLTFPGEMCFSVGFFLSDGSSSPTCLDGTWIER